MKNLSINLRKVVGSRADADGLLQHAGDAVLIERGLPRWLLIRCPCGCGEDIPVNLDHRAGKAWRWYIDDRRRVSLFPSVWRDTGCESHFIVWRDRILLFGAYASDFEDETLAPDQVGLARRVFEVSPVEGGVTYLELADMLEEIPWDVLDACRFLVREGSFTEGSGKSRQMFWRAAQRRLP